MKVVCVCCQMKVFCTSVELYFNKLKERLSLQDIVIDSPYLAERECHLGSREAWYSFDISEKEEMMKLGAVEQAAGQVACINRAVEKGLMGVSEERKLVVQYEDFCTSPESYFNKLKERLSEQGYNVDVPYLSEKEFDCHNNLRMSECEMDSAKNTYRKFNGEIPQQGAE